MTARAGERAPDFRVETTEGPRSLGSFLAAGPLVLVFYVEDATPACTAQLSAFRDEYDAVRDLNAQVLAVSTDSLEAHRAFSERAGGLPFPLASDPELALSKAYGVADEEARRARRAVFVIGTDGLVTEAFVPFQPSVSDQFVAIFRALGWQG